jgi:hypothetical protein
MQICIDERVYAVHAALTEKGFIVWDVFQGPVTELEVSTFIQKVRRHPTFDNEHSFRIFDNASNQRTDRVRGTMESIFRGRYRYCSPYSPEFKPIENAFSLVRAYIKNHNKPNGPNLSHICQINNAFTYYSDAVGQNGDACFNMFDIFRRNHDIYLKSLL